MMADDDRELMLRARSGSREAFDAIVSRWQGRLLTFFFRHCGDRELAEDCSQEVFVRLYKARDRYTPDALFSTFLFTIARHYWIDVARARAIRPDAQRGFGGAAEDDDREDRLSRLPAAELAPPAQAVLADDLARMHAALERLPEPLRDVVQLGVIETLPYAEVSRILAIPIGTVKSRVHAAVIALRAAMAADGGKREAGKSEATDRQAGKKEAARE
jgi:RNA polymerase sigma-70 factor, ECF subfamily